MRALLSLALITCTAMAVAYGAARAGEPQLLYVNFPSTVLSTFLNQPVQIAATILLPDSYYKELQRRYPVVYVISGFDDFYEIDAQRQLAWQNPMRALGAQFMIVFLRGMIEFDGEAIHNQYADSANDGPWGTALTSQFIPGDGRAFSDAWRRRTLSLRAFIRRVVGVMASSELPRCVQRRMGGLAGRGRFPRLLRSGSDEAYGELLPKRCGECVRCVSRTWARYLDDARTRVGPGRVRRLTKNAN